MGRGRTLGGTLVGGCAAVLLVAVARHPAGGSGTYALLNPGVAYPCAPIHYTVSAAEAPPDFVEVVHGAVGKVSAASGYRFFFDGMTADRNFDARATGPVLVGFAATGESSQFAGDTIGLGGSSYNAANVYVTGSVMLDATQYAELGDLADRQAIVMHELGHVLGLDHVDDPGELMNAAYTDQRGFGPGDLAGLRHQFELSCPGQAKERATNTSATVVTGARHSTFGPTPRVASTTRRSPSKCAAALGGT